VAGGQDFEIRYEANDRQIENPGQEGREESGQHAQSAGRGPINLELLLLARPCRLRRDGPQPGRFVSIATALNYFTYLCDGEPAAASR
jgi:hypothetical protein